MDTTWRMVGRGMCGAREAVLVATAATLLATAGCSSTPEGAADGAVSATAVKAPTDDGRPGFGEPPESPSTSATLPSAGDAAFEEGMRRLEAAARQQEITDLEAPAVEQTTALPETRAEPLDAENPRANLAPSITLDELAEEAASAADATGDGDDRAADDAASALAELPDAEADATPAMPRELSAAEEIELLVEQLASAVRRSGEDDLSPVPSMAQLAVLDLFRPGTFNTHHPLFESQADRVARALSDDDFAFLVAWRDLFTDLHVRLSDEAVDLDALADTVADLDEAMNRWRPLEISTAKLCTQVDGFGVYAPIRTFEKGKHKFLSGRAHPVIVYLEAEHFGHEAMTHDGVEGFKVELIQTLTLFHAGTPKVEPDGDLVAWRTEPQTITDFSRRQRDDFFVVQIITLPKSLSVGSYRLKVELDDPSTETTAQALIEIDIVADISAFESGVATAPTGGRR